MTTVRRLAAVVVASLLLAGCEPGSSATGAQPSPATATASVAPGGCGPTPILLGGLPGWADSAGVPASLRYVLAHEGNLLGVLFAYPLVAPPRDGGPNNKILWIARDPRHGKPLELTLTPMAGGDPVTQTEPANSGPGEIYPSIVDVPGTGCWQVVAEWDGHRATLELPYEPRQPR